MIPKKERTLELYEEAGAAMRLFKAAAVNMQIAVSAVLSAKDSDRISAAMWAIDLKCARADTNLFTDFPDAGHDYCDVFYGALNDKPRTEVDRRVIERAHEMAEELFHDRRRESIDQVHT